MPRLHRRRSFIIQRRCQHSITRCPRCSPPNTSIEKCTRKHPRPLRAPGDCASGGKSIRLSHPSPLPPSTRPALRRLLCKRTRVTGPRRPLGRWPQWAVFRDEGAVVGAGYGAGRTGVWGGWLCAHRSEGRFHCVATVCDSDTKPLDRLKGTRLPN
jgi:hypothetical protein